MTPKQQQEVFKKYAELKREAKEAVAPYEAKIKELAPEVVQILKDFETDRIQNSWGTFSIKKRKTYTYSDEVYKLMEEEEKNGKAELKEVEYLDYRTFVQGDDE